jgi:hypothetical protein
MGGRHLQRLTDPLAGGESAPAVRRPCGWMRAAVDEDRPIERAHELHAVADDLPEIDRGPSESVHRQRRRHWCGASAWPALISPGAPDRFGCGTARRSASLVEARDRDSRPAAAVLDLIAIQPPFSGDSGGRAPPPWAGHNGSDGSGNGRAAGTRPPIDPQSRRSGQAIDSQALAQDKLDACGQIIAQEARNGASHTFTCIDFAVRAGWNAPVWEHQ